MIELNAIDVITSIIQSSIENWQTISLVFFIMLSSGLISALGDKSTTTRTEPTRSAPPHAPQIEKEYENIFSPLNTDIFEPINTDIFEPINKDIFEPINKDIF